MKKYAFELNNKKITVNAKNANRYYSGCRMHFNCPTCKNQVIGEDGRCNLLWPNLVEDISTNRVFCKMFEE